jgi:hypothetical protein
MFLTPYNTTIAAHSAGVIERKVVSELNYARTEGALVQADERFPKIFAVAGRGVALDRIPAFGHPVVDGEYTYVDLRSYNSQVLTSGQYKAPKEGAAAFLIKQAILQTAWTEDRADRQSLWLFSSLPIKGYANWIGELVTRRLALDYTAQMKLTALAAWFYLCLHFNENELESDQDALAVRLSRVSDQGIEECREAVALGYLADTDAFSNAVQRLGSLKLEHFTNGVFYSIMASSWFGTPTAKESVSVALEHPPTWIALLHTVVNERVYNKTPIFLSTQRFLKREALEQFDRSFVSLVRQLGN